MNRSDQCVGILVPPGPDRTLVREIIEAEGWATTLPAEDPDPDGPWLNLDAIVVDEAWLSQSREGIERTRHAVGSEFLPVLMISGSGRPPGPLPECCDQILVYPTTRAEFVARMRGLLRARSESRRVYRSFFENALIGVYRATRSGTILMANDAFARMLGFDSVGALKNSGIRVPDLAADQGGDSTEAAGATSVSRALERSGRAEAVGSRWRTRTGDIVHVVHSARLVQTSSSRNEALVEGTVENVTALADSRERLAESEAFLQSAIDSLSAHVAILDPDGRILRVNDAWRSFERRSRPDDADDVGTNYLTICDVADASEAGTVAEGIRSVIEGSAPMFSAEYPCHSPTDFRWFRIVVTPFPGDPPRKVVVAHENVTEMKVAQKRFQHLIEGSRELTLVVTSEGMVGYHSPSAVEFVGQEDIDGRRLSDFVHPDDREVVRCEELVRAAGENVECRIRHADGTWRDIEWAVTDMRDDTIVRGLVLHGRDITERRAMLGELRAREREIREMQKMEAVGVLAGGVAHDFNNLLTTIQGNLDLVTDSLHGDAGPESEEHLAEIRRAAQQGAYLTRRLLVFSRKEPEVEPSTEELNDLIRGLGKMLQRVVVETVEIHVDLADRPLPVHVRSGEIEQVIMNLVINAAQAMPAGGNLTIRSRLERIDPVPDPGLGEGRMPAGAHRLPPGSYAVLDVVDTGEGIPPEVRDRIFEPFFTTKPRGEGTGLGLATVFGIVDRAGGAIDVSSEVGLGSRFTVSLPLVSGARIEDEPDAPPPSREDGRGDETLLLVEDEDPVRRSARRGLERFGYTVLEARHGVEALERLESPDGSDVKLIVTDFVMPEMSGLELAKAVHERRPGLPILITSGYPDAELDLPDGLLWGTLPKPYELTALGARIRELIRASPKD